VELQGRVGDLRAQGLGLASISYDSAEILKAYSDLHGITFPLLSDAGSATIKAYGILNTVVEEALGPNGQDPAVQADLKVFATVNAASERLRGIPFPGTFIVDRQGRVTSRFFEDYYRERMTVANVLLKLGTGGSVEGTKVSTDHLQIQTYPSDATVALGDRFSLALNVAPASGMHVYAPGASGYRVIGLTLTPQPFVRTFPVEYPASEIYFFEPLNERVPVYQKPFTIVQEVVPEASSEAQAAFKGKDGLTITGTLEYQACDDKVCYNPTTVPLSWTVALKPYVAGFPAAPPRQ
jgi:peroxiredoxin